MKNLTLLFSFLFTFGFSLLAQSSDSIFNDSLVQESAEEFVPAADILHNIFAIFVNTYHTGADFGFDSEVNR